MKNLYYTVQELLREGKSVAMVATLMDLPKSLVSEIRDDMEEYAAEFEGNLVKE